MIKILTDAFSLLVKIGKQLEENMATLKSFQDLLSAVDAETTRIGNKIQQLVDQLKETGLSASEETAIFDQLTATADRLKTIGADSSNPIPPEPPVEPPVEG